VTIKNQQRPQTVDLGFGVIATQAEISRGNAPFRTLLNKLWAGQYKGFRTTPRFLFFN
jgi:hypothetical protein